MKEKMIIKGKARGSVAFADENTVYGGIETLYEIGIKRDGITLTVSVKGVDVTVNLEDIIDGVKAVTGGIKRADI